MWPEVDLSENLRKQAAAYGGVEHVDGLHGGFAFLLEPEHQVDPLAQSLGHLVRLQRLPVDQDEETRVVSGPRRQVHVVDPLAVLPDTEIETCEG